MDDGFVQASGNAPRFSLTLPMRYRPVGQTRWRSTMTANVSSSGAPFLAAEALPAGRQLQTEISTTEALLKASRIVATSEVVRQGSNVQPLITAAQHQHYRVVHGDVD